MWVCRRPLALEYRSRFAHDFHRSEPDRDSVKRIIRHPSTSEVVQGADHLVRVPAPSILAWQDKEVRVLALTTFAGEQIPMTHPETLSIMLADMVAGMPWANSKGKL